MPHRHSADRNHHCMVRQTMAEVANGRRRRGNRPRKCEHLLGCTVEHLVRRLRCTPGDRRHLDHIIPLSQGGDHHFTNLRLLDPHEHMLRTAQASAEEAAAVALLRLRYCSAASSGKPRTPRA